MRKRKWQSPASRGLHARAPKAPAMNSPKCKVFEPSLRYVRKNVRGLSYDGKELTIAIEGENSECAQIVFHYPAGFRVLDERDLCEFWNSYSESNGWFYEVEQGGWMELESRRSLFNSPSWHENLTEFLIVDNQCVSVFATRLPLIRDVGVDPIQRV
jgi:hypothetical protein